MPEAMKSLIGGRTWKALEAHAATKVLAQRIIPDLESSKEESLKHDSSANVLIKQYRGIQKGRAK